MTSLSDRTLRRLAWAAWWFLVAMFVADELVKTQASASNSGGDYLFAAVVLAFPIVGLLIVRRQPRNTVGWLLLAIGFAWGLSALADSYALYGLAARPGSLPGADVAAALASASWAPGIGLMGTFLVLLYPDGHLPSGRWRPLAWLSALTIFTVTVIVALTPGRLGVEPFADLRNPLGWESGAPVLTILLVAFLPILPLCFVACAVALVRRFRRSRGVERQQLKWLAAAGAVVASLFVLAMAGSLLKPGSGWFTGADPPWLVAVQNIAIASFALMPIAIGIAILRHRLYDVDLVIKRTLVYGSLSLTLAAVYLGSVLFLQLVLEPITVQSDLAVAGSTLAVAALFRPARRRIQQIVDRRFYRSRYDATLTLDTFAGRLRHEVDLDAVGADLRQAVQDTVQPAHVSLWVRQP